MKVEEATLQHQLRARFERRLDHGEDALVELVPLGGVELLLVLLLGWERRLAREGDGAIKLTLVPTGRFSYEIRHLIRDPIDLTATLLTHCGDPKRFGGNHEAIMYRYDEWIEKARKTTQAQRSRWQFGSLSARFQAIASDLDFYDIMETRGYERAEIDQCLTDEAKASALADRSAADAERYGITGTPSFVLDGELLEGTHDWSALEPQLADAL